MTDLERFEARYIPEPMSGCWLWTGMVYNGGYGLMYADTEDGRKRVMAHRWAYEHFRGPIDPDLTFDHLCRVRCCVNPWHGEVVTRGENVLRGTAPAALNQRKTHCKRGHLFDDENTGPASRSGGRRCRTCHREAEYARNHDYKENAL